MTGLRLFKWLSLGAVASAAVGGVLLVRQIRTPPVPNAYYVALGSSYAAGLGLGPRAPGSPIVSQRSVNGYPQQLARLLRVPSFTDMTSSGSTVQHVLHGGQMGLGPQIDALGPDTRLVTLTAGGNDVGYVGDLVAMAYRNAGGAIGTVVGMVWNRERATDERPFDRLGNELRTLLREIRRRAPKARIIVVTYPAILPATASCPALGISNQQAALMRSVADRLAQTTREAAIAERSTVVDMAALSNGHDACGSAPWVNGFRPQTGSAFHPTLEGARATAQAIAAAIGTLN